MKLPDEFCRHGPLQQLGNRLTALFHRAADETVEHLRQREVHAELSEHFGEDPGGDELTVDQHPVAIEDHQLAGTHELLMAGHSPRLLPGHPHRQSQGRPPQPNRACRHHWPAIAESDR